MRFRFTICKFSNLKKLFRKIKITFFVCRLQIMSSHCPIFESFHYCLTRIAFQVLATLEQCRFPHHQPKSVKCIVYGKISESKIFPFFPCINDNQPIQVGDRRLQKLTQHSQSIDLIHFMY